MNSFKLIILSLCLVLTGTNYAACDFTTADNVTITPDGNHNTDPQYTQTYVLTDNDGIIVATSNSGNFGPQNFGSYIAYAINYENADAPSTLPVIGINITNINDGCTSISPGLNLTVCETSILTVCEDSGDDIIVALTPDYNFDPNFSQVIIIVDDATGQIDFVSNFNAATGTVNYNTNATGDLPQGSYTVYTVNYENSNSLISLGLTAGTNWTGNFGSACVDASVGNPILVEDCTFECGTCTTPDCLIAGPYPDYATAELPVNQCSQMNDMSANPISGASTFTTYHTLTSSNNGTVGVIVSVGVNSIVGGTPCPITRVATIYPIGGPCDGTTEILPTTTTANGSPFYNPEWTGLTPNTNYVVEITFTIPADCELVDHCESYYAPSCDNAIGNITVTGGTNVGTDEYDLTNCETIDFSVTGENLGEGVQYGWAVFNCAPTLPLSLAELSDLTSNPCYLGSDYGTTTSDFDAAGISGTIPGNNTQLWILPYISEAADQPDANSNGCYAVGSPIQINYIPPSCGDCNSPGCSVGNVPTFDDRTYLLCDDPCADLNDMTYTTYHTVSTDAFGNIGVVQTVNAGCNVTRTAVLRDITNTCTSSDIAPTTQNANSVASGFNPEWIGLLPNTSYVLIITTIIPPGCNYDYACVDFYGIPQCSTTVGSTSAITSNNTNNDYVLCWGESIDLTTTGFVLPDVNITGNEAFGYAVYRTPMPGLVPNSADAGFVEYLIGTGTNASLTLINDGSYTPPFISNPDQTIYLYPITMDDGPGQAHDSNNDNCFAVGGEIAITFLNEINVVTSEDCLNEAAVYEIDGGYPEFFTGNYNLNNLGNGSLSSSTLGNAGGTISITGLLPGNNHFIDITDDNGCTLTTLPVLYPVNLDFDSIVLTDPTCSYLCDGSISLYSSDATQYSINGGNYQTSNSFNNTCTGTYTVTIEDNNCFIDSIITIGIPTPVEITNSPDNTLCIGASETLTANATGGTGSGYQFFWDNTIGTNTNVVTPVNNPTTYSVYAIDANGCSSDTNDILLTLLDPISITTAILDSICEGETIQINATATGGDSNYNYSWTNNDGTGWSMTGSTINVSPSNTTEYYLSVNDGCTTPSANETVTIEVNLNPTASFTVDTLEGCYPLVVNFSNNSLGNIDNDCIWTINGESFNNCGDQTYTFNEVGCYDITLYVTTTSGCSNNYTENNYICVHEYPMANFDLDDTIINVYNTDLYILNTSIDNFQNEWSIEGTSTNQLDLEYSLPTVPGTHPLCLEVTNQYGCIDDTCVNVIVEDVMTIFVPNAFTPDGDNDNDKFYPVINSEMVEDFDFEIYNRWGQLIFKSSSSNSQWDGTYQGKPSQQDVYVWKIEYKNFNSTKKMTGRGHVTLIR